MYQFFFRIFMRNLRRKGMFQMLNIAGLSIGLTVVMLICAYVFNEYSFDRSFTNHARIYRINSYMTTILAGRTINLSTNALAPAVQEDIPEVEAVVRTQELQTVAKVNNVPYKITQFCWADTSFFQLFDTPFIYGTSETVFARPNTVAVSETQARIMFGDRNPLGETIQINQAGEFEVSGVYRDFPANASFMYGMVGNFMSAPELIRVPQWGNINLETWCMLAPGADQASVESSMQSVIKNHSTEQFFEARLQPLKRIHLHSKDYMYFNTDLSLGDIARVRMFALLAIIILLVACINYMNLSTARAQKQSKEIGISKAIGAKRKSIIARLYIETSMLTMLSFALSLVLTILLLHVFNSLIGQNIPRGVFIQPLFLVGILMVYVVTTLISASYPAFYLSGFAPLTVIRKATTAKGGSHETVRKILSTLQFAVAVILIAWVMVIRLQMRYMEGKDIGYNPENLLAISITHSEGAEAMKTEYSAQEAVLYAALSEGFPFGTANGNPLFKTIADMETSQETGQVSTSSTIITNCRVDPDMIDAAQLHLIAGATIPKRKDDNAVVSVVLNRNAVEYLETTPEEIIGTMIPMGLDGDEPVQVCGVVEDFHFKNMREPMTPYAMSNSNGNWKILLLRVKEGNTTAQLQLFENIFKRHYPNDIFEVTYVDTEILRSYEAERMTNRLILCFSMLAIFVACMGVFGLTAFMAEQRTREIGIRKVLGASIMDIVSLFTRSYMYILLVSLLISIPVAWWTCSSYLDGFAFRITLHWWIFMVAAAITVAVTLFTSGMVSINAARVHPVKSIKSE